MLYYVSYTDGGNSANVIRMPAEGGAAELFQSASDQPPVFSGDGKLAAFFEHDPLVKQSMISIHSVPDSKQRLTLVNQQFSNVTFSPDGSGDTELLFEAAGTSFGAPDWSPDGVFVVAPGLTLATGSTGIWRVDVATRTGRILRQDPGSNLNPRISPDSKFIAYAQTVDGQSSVWTMTADGSSHWLVAQSGSQPVWGPQGQSVYFKRENSVYRVPVEIRNGFRTTGDPVEAYRSDRKFRFYDLSPDGSTLIRDFQADQEESDLNYLEVVVNWTNRLPSR